VLPEASSSGDAVPASQEVKEGMDQGPHVLLVERNAILRRLVAQDLQRHACRVSAVATPAEAQRALRVIGRIDVALLELPPELSTGEERPPTADVRAFESLLAALSRARAQGEHRPLIVALTAQPGRGSQAACDAAGMDLCIAKPLTSTAIRDLLSRCSA